MSDEAKNKCESGFLVVDLSREAHVHRCLLLINKPEHPWSQPVPIDEWEKVACCSWHRAIASRWERSGDTCVLFSSPVNYAKWRKKTKSGT